MHLSSGSVSGSVVYSVELHCTVTVGVHILTIRSVCYVQYGSNLYGIFE